MAVYVSGFDIHFWRGDTGNIVFEGLPVDKDYTVYFSVTDIETGKKVVDELSLQSERRNKVTFFLSADYTNQFKVPAGENKTTYQYGLKICTGNEEHTLLPEVEVTNEKVTFKKAPKVYVYQQFVEGII